MFDMQFDIDVFTRHASYTMRKLWHACKMSNKTDLDIATSSKHVKMLDVTHALAKYRFDCKTQEDIFATWLVQLTNTVFHRQ